MASNTAAFSKAAFLKTLTKKPIIVMITISLNSAADVPNLKAIIAELNSFLKSTDSSAPAITASKTSKKVPAEQTEKESATPVVLATPVIEEQPEITGAVEQAQNETITLEAVRAKTQEMSQKHGKEKVKAVLTSFGSENLTKLPADKYAEYITKLNEL